MTAAPPPGVAMEPLGELTSSLRWRRTTRWPRTTEPISDAELLRHRAVAVADSAQRMSPLTVNLLPGQDVLTVATMAAKIEAQLRGLGCGFVPEPMVRHHIAPAGWWCARCSARASRCDWATPGAATAAPRRERAPAGPGAAAGGWNSWKPGHAPGAAGAPRPQLTAAMEPQP